MIKIINKWRAKRIYKSIKQLDAEIELLTSQLTLEWAKFVSLGHGSLESYNRQHDIISINLRCKKQQRRKLMANISRNVMAKLLELNLVND